MIILNDCFGSEARLTAERLAHIQEHVEMKGFESEITKVLNSSTVGAPAALGRSGTIVL